MGSTKRLNYRRRRVQVEALERRILFNADVPVLVPDSDSANLTPPPIVQSVQAPESASDADGTALELVIIDPNTPDYQQILDDLQAQNTSYAVHVLDAERDGLTQLSEILEGYDNVSAVHLISHGESGSLALGAGSVDLESLWIEADVISGWADSFT